MTLRSQRRSRAALWRFHSPRLCLSSQLLLVVGGDGAEVDEEPPTTEDIPSDQPSMKHGVSIFLFFVSVFSFPRPLRSLRAIL